MKIKLQIKEQLTDFYFKRLEKMINDPGYDLNERFAPRLLDLGFIFLDEWSEYFNGAYLRYSFYTVTDQGKKAYGGWKKRCKVLENLK